MEIGNPNLIGIGSYEVPKWRFQSCENDQELRIFSMCFSVTILIFEGRVSTWSNSIQLKCWTSKLQYVMSSFHWYQDHEFLALEHQVSKRQSGHGRADLWIRLEVTFSWQTKSKSCNHCLQAYAVPNLTKISALHKCHKHVPIKSSLWGTFA